MTTTYEFDELIGAAWLPGWSRPLTAEDTADMRARRDAERDHDARCERTVAPGTCTGCETPAAELLPWSGERLCVNCADIQLDLLAKAVAEGADVYVAVAR
jgi:hypothetical protein